MRSLSEIETAVKRASKAVGFSWGNSEEVGKSIRQLELFGLQGIKNLNQYYKERNIKKFEDLNLIYELNEASFTSSDSIPRNLIIELCSLPKTRLLLLSTL